KLVQGVEGRHPGAFNLQQPAAFGRAGHHPGDVPAAGGLDVGKVEVASAEAVADQSDAHGFSCSWARGSSAYRREAFASLKCSTAHSAALRTMAAPNQLTACASPMASPTQPSPRAPAAVKA